MTKEFENSIIIRSRDEKQLSKCDVLVDVGGVYDPKTHRYDHHQKTFTETLSPFTTKLSSAGLIFK